MATNPRTRARMGGLATLAKHGADTISAPMCKGSAEWRERKCREEIDPDYQIPDDEFYGVRFPAWKSVYMSKLALKSAAARRAKAHERRKK